MNVREEMAKLEAARRAKIRGLSTAYRLKKQAAGYCVACGCWAEPVEDREHCQEHLDKMKVFTKQLRVRRVAAGMCGQCGVREQVGTIFCIKCRITTRGKAKLPQGLPRECVRLLRDYQSGIIGAELHERRAEGLKRLLSMFVGSRITIDDSRNKTMIIRYYGLYGDRDPESLEQIGQSYGITRERVRQIVDKFSLVAAELDLPGGVRDRTYVRQRVKGLVMDVRGAGWRD